MQEIRILRITVIIMIIGLLIDTYTDVSQANRITALEDRAPWEVGLEH
jgi:hypothetical protein